MTPFKLFKSSLLVLVMDKTANVEPARNMATEKPNAKGVQVFYFQNIHGCFSSDFGGAEKL